MALFSKGIWAVVADGEKALFVENEGTTQAPKLRLHEKREQDLEATHEMGTDRPGRMPDPGKGQLSAMEQTDWHRQAKERFAVTVAGRIDKLVAAGKIDRFVLVAPPQMLAVLRDNLGAASRKALFADLPKTMTHHPMDKLGKALAADIDQI